VRTRAGVPEEMMETVFPSTIPLCHQRLANLHLLATRYEGMLQSLRTEIDWLRKGAEEAKEQWHRLLAEKDALLTRAETCESRLRSLERGAHLTDRSLAISPNSACTLQLVYEFGSLALMKLINVPAPPHPRLLVDDILDEAAKRTYENAGSKSRVDDEDATVIGASVVLTTLREPEYGYEADAHRRARDHQRGWVAASGAGAAAGSLHYCDG
jgi:hypothetical protein